MSTRWLVVLALVPSAYFAWTNRDFPHLGFFHDDGVYWTSARSLAEGTYRIPTLPDQPWQTKYPPLFPAVLSLFWLANPQFPANLPAAMILAWAAFPVWVFLCWHFFREWGFGAGAAAAMASWIALFPLSIFLSATLMPDLWWAAAVLGCCALVERERPWTAGLCAAAAYLLRTAALPLLIAVPLWLWWRHRRRHIVPFVLPLLPAIAGWMLWLAAHPVHRTDLVHAYQTDYLRYREFILDAVPAHLLLWKNVGSLVQAAGGLAIPGLEMEAWSMPVAGLLAALIVVGNFRLARERGLRLFPCFVAAFLLMQLLWHYPPSPRLILCVMPVVMGGLAGELRSLLPMIRAAMKKGTADRIVAGLLVATAVLLAVVALHHEGTAIANLRVQVFGKQREIRRQLEPAYAWIRHHAPPESAVLTSLDAVLYLETGRHAVSLPASPLPLYLDRSDEVLRPFEDLPRFFTENDLTYVLLTPDESFFLSEDAARRRAHELIRAGSVPVYEDAYVSLRRLH